jgi:formate dehydrogenase
MVLLTRSICRLARPAFQSSFSRSLFTDAASARAGFSPSSRVLSRGALALRHNPLGSIRTLTGKREKVKVLLVLYDGKEHAKQVRSLSFFNSIELQLPCRCNPNDRGSSSSTRQMINC